MLALVPLTFCCINVVDSIEQWLGYARAQQAMDYIEADDLLFRELQRGGDPVGVVVVHGAVNAAPSPDSPKRQ